MSSIFKCLVELNNHKYIVCIDCNYNEITFNTFYYEIQNQTKQNISHETHEFQIFDNDFNEYVLISSDKQLINNLSKIRIIPKIDSNVENVIKNVEVLSVCTPEESQKSAKITINDKSDKTEITFNTNQKPNNNDLNDIYSKTSEFNNYIKNETKPKIKNNEKVVAKEEVLGKGEVLVENELNNCCAETVVKPKPETVSKNTPLDSKEMKTTDNSNSSPVTNYFGPDIPECGHYSSSSQLPFETRVEKIGKISTIALRFKSYDIKAFKNMLRIMTYNRYHFKYNQSNDLLSNQKWIIVSNEMKHFYNEWSPQKCRDSFMGSVKWYKKVLENAPNYEIAYNIYPLFESIHSLDLKFFLKYENYMTVCQLRDIFHSKSYERNDTQHKIAIKPTINTVERETASSSHCSESASSYKSDHHFIHYQTDDRKSFSYNTFVKKTNNLSAYDIKAFKSLAQTVDSIVEQFGREVKHFWQLVSNIMIEKGFHEFNAKKCEHKYILHVCDYYTMTLTHSADYKTATSIYPLFEFIHALDLRKTVKSNSFYKITNLRERYDYKFRNNKT